MIIQRVLGTGKGNGVGRRALGDNLTIHPDHFCPGIFTINYERAHVLVRIFGCIQLNPGAGLDSQRYPRIHIQIVDDMIGIVFRRPGSVFG